MPNILVPQSGKIFPDNPFNYADPLNQGLIAWYLSLPQFSGSKFFDLTPRASHGILTNGPTWIANTRPGALGPALALDGVDDYVSIADADYLSPPTAITVVFWAYRRTDSFIAVKGDGNSIPTTEWWVRSLSGSLQVSLFTSANRSDITANTLSANAWHQIGFTWDGATHRAIQDGVLVGPNSISGTLNNTSLSMQLGRLAGFSNLNGMLDDFRLYNRALSANEVLAIYNTSRAGYPTQLRRRRFITLPPPTPTPITCTSGRLWPIKSKQLAISNPVNFEDKLNKNLMIDLISSPEFAGGNIFPNLAKSKNVARLKGANWTSKNGRTGVYCSGGSSLDINFNEQPTKDVFDFALRIVFYPVSWTGGFTALIDQSDRDLPIFIDTSGNVSFTQGLSTGITTSLGMTAGSRWDLIYTRIGSSATSNGATYTYLNGVLRGSPTSVGNSPPFDSLWTIGKNSSGGGTDANCLYESLQLWHGRGLDKDEVWALYNDSLQGYKRQLSRTTLFAFLPARNLYVRQSGSDTNPGTSPGQAWRTWGKALGVTGIANGDTLYVGGGTYREVVTATLPNPVSETRIVGDVDGTNTGDAGEVILTPYTVNDRTLPTGTIALTLDNKDFLSFENIIVVGGTGNTGGTANNVSSTFSKELKFRRCVFILGSSAGSNVIRVRVDVPPDVMSNLLFDQCVFWGGLNSGTGACVRIGLATSGLSDYNTNANLTNCLCIGDALLYIPSTGSGFYKGGGIRVDRCSLIGGGLSAAVRIDTDAVSMVYPVVVYNSYLTGTLVASNSGQLLEDYNIIFCNTARTSVIAGVNSISNGSYANLIDLGQSFLFGTTPRPFGTPMTGSPLLGFGNQTGSPDVDLWNRPIPSGGASILKGIGCLERHETGVRETTVVGGGLGSSLKLVGPGDHDRYVMVDPVPTIIKVAARYDTAHGTTNKPQLRLLGNGEIGVIAQTITMTVGTDTWETLATAQFTPTARGVVVVRLLNRAAAGSGIAYFDNANLV